MYIFIFICTCLCLCLYLYLYLYRYLYLYFHLSIYKHPQMAFDPGPEEAAPDSPCAGAEARAAASAARPPQDVRASGQAQAANTRKGKIILSLTVEMDKLDTQLPLLNMHIYGMPSQPHC